MSFAVVGYAAPGWAQDDETRPATTTFWGDTGLWFVPTGEVLPSGDASMSVHHNEFDFRQGNTSVSFWPVTGAIGAGPMEVFGSLRVITRIDRDTAPLLFAGPNDEAGGLVNEHPSTRDSWTGNQFGDLFLGAKVNLMSQARPQPLALAVRGTVKFPTGDRESGAGTGEYDGFVDIIGSREAGGVELAAFGGMAWRGDPDDISISNGFRWGAGAGFPTRSRLRGTAEIHGEALFDGAVTAPEGLLVGADGSLSPATSRLTDQIQTSVGVTWQAGGFLLGAALNYRFNLETDEATGVPASTGGDALGMQFRIGFHRGVRVYVPPPPAVAAAPAPAPAPEPTPTPSPAANRAPAVRAVCDPCTLQGGQTATLRAEASDPDGDPLSFLWSATGGTLVDTRAAITTWRAETAPGLITFTVTAEDGRGATVSDTVTIEVSLDLEFEDVHFDFDSYRLRPNALPLLEPVIAALQNNPAMRLDVEGHTCSIGTAEYNLALGERRANSVRAYLVSRGLAAERIFTISHGEERPAHDNAQESTRQLNRRAVLIVRLTEEGSR
jgi:outer membrane protein OmpA-like peptidoglycan-associated protein